MTRSEKGVYVNIKHFYCKKFTEFMVSAVLSWAPCRCAANDELPFCNKKKFKYDGNYGYAVNGCIQQLLVEGPSGGFHMGDGERAVVESDKCQFSLRSVLVSCAVIRCCLRISSWTLTLNFMVLYSGQRFGWDIFHYTWYGENCHCHDTFVLLPV
jgi:hypothetical protein